MPGGGTETSVENHAGGWIFERLWTPDAHARCSVRIPDTVLVRDGEVKRWLFTSKEGVVKKKTRDNTTVEAIEKKFLAAGKCRDAEAPVGVFRDPDGVAVPLTADQLCRDLHQLYQDHVQLPSDQEETGGDTQAHEMSALRSSPDPVPSRSPRRLGPAASPMLSLRSGKSGASERSGNTTSTMASMGAMADRVARAEESDAARVMEDQRSQSVLFQAYVRPKGDHGTVYRNEYSRGGFSAPSCCTSKIWETPMASNSPTASRSNSSDALPMLQVNGETLMTLAAERRRSLFQASRSSSVASFSSSTISDVPALRRSSLMLGQGSDSMASLLSLIDDSGTVRPPQTNEIACKSTQINRMLDEQTQKLVRFLESQHRITVRKMTAFYVLDEDDHFWFVNGYIELVHRRPALQTASAHLAAAATSSSSSSIAATRRKSPTKNNGHDSAAALADEQAGSTIKATAFKQPEWDSRGPNSFSKRVLAADSTAALRRRGSKGGVSNSQSSTSLASTTARAPTTSPSKALAVSTLAQVRRRATDSAAGACLGDYCHASVPGDDLPADAIQPDRRTPVSARSVVVARLERLKRLQVRVKKGVKSRRGIGCGGDVDTSEEQSWVDMMTSEEEKHLRFDVCDRCKHVYAVLDRERAEAVAYSPLFQSTSAASSVAALRRGESTLRVSPAPKPAASAASSSSASLPAMRRVASSTSAASRRSASPVLMSQPQAKAQIFSRVQPPRDYSIDPSTGRLAQSRYRASASAIAHLAAGDTSVPPERLQREVLLAAAAHRHSKAAERRRAPTQLEIPGEDKHAKVHAVSLDSATSASSASSTEATAARIAAATAATATATISTSAAMPADSITPASSAVSTPLASASASFRSGRHGFGSESLHDLYLESPGSAVAAASKKSTVAGKPPLSGSSSAATSPVMKAASPAGKSRRVRGHWRDKSVSRWGLDTPPSVGQAGADDGRDSRPSSAAQSASSASSTAIPDTRPGSFFSNMKPPHVYTTDRCQECGTQTFFKLDRTVTMPYLVLNSEDAATTKDRLPAARANVVVVHDVFDTIRYDLPVYRRFVKQVSGVQVLLWNYPGQAYTTAPTDRHGNNDYLANVLFQLLRALRKSREFDPTKPLYLVGYGAGAAIATLFAAMYAGSSSISLDAMVLVNPISWTDSRLQLVLENWQQLARVTLPQAGNSSSEDGDGDEATEDDATLSLRRDAEISALFWSHLNLSCEYLDEVSVERAVADRRQVSNPIGHDGRAFLVSGILRNVDLRPLLQRIQSAVVLVQSTRDALVALRRHRASFITALGPSQDLATVFAAGSGLHCVSMLAGHDVAQERPRDLTKLLVRLLCHDWSRLTETETKM